MRKNIGNKPLEMFNLKRYRSVVENISSGGEFGPKKTVRCEQTHVPNKPYAICKFQKNILENMTKWPEGTYFEIEPVEETKPQLLAA